MKAVDQMQKILEERRKIGVVCGSRQKNVWSWVNVNVNMNGSWFELARRVEAAAQVRLLEIARC